MPNIDGVVLTRSESVTMSPEELAAKLQARLDSPNRAAEALAAFAALAAPIAAAGTAVNTANFGPTEVSGSCGYSCSNTWSWGIKFDGRPALPFPSTLAQMSCAPQFGTAFDSVKNFLASLPGTQSTLDAQIGTIRAIDAAIKKAGGHATSAQLLELTTAFASATGAVLTSEGVNNTALQTLASFESKYAGYKGLLQSQATSTQTAFDDSINAARNKLISEAKCGTGTVTSKAAGLVALVNASISSLAASFSTANIAFSAALTASTLVAGEFLGLQAMYQAIQTALSDAKGLDPSSAMRIVKLDIAANTWTSLVSNANANLAT